MSQIIALKEELRDLRRHVDELEQSALAHIAQDDMKMEELERQIAAVRENVKSILNGIARGQARGQARAQEAKRLAIRGRATRGRASREAATANAGRKLLDDIFGQPAAGQKLFLTFQ